jgi:hypothetical protein
MPRSTCTRQGCDRPTKARGLCPKHYMQYRRGSDGPDRRVKYRSARDRILQNVRINVDGCWIWQLHVDPAGYGRVTLPGRPGYLAHRASYEAFVGQIPTGLVLDHVKARGCRSTACVNPAHLEPVTNAENLLRGETFQGINARKTHCVNGHEFTPENTYVVPDKGWRQCRTCGRLRQRVAVDQGGHA